MTIIKGIEPDMETMLIVAYDQGWQSQWDDMENYGPFSRHLRRIIKRMIRPLEFESVLDVGCGQGSFLEELQAEFPCTKPRGVDLSPSAVKLACERVPGGSFAVLDITEHAQDEKCDIVVCSEVLEHIPDDYKPEQDDSQVSVGLNTTAANANI